MKYFIEAATNKKEKVTWKFPFVLTLNTLLAHSFGVSVGREGVAVQLGGAIGGNIAPDEFSPEKKQFFVKYLTVKNIFTGILFREKGA